MNRIVLIGLAAVAVAALVVIGIVLLAGRGTGAQLTPSSALAQTPGLAAPVASAKAGGLDTRFGGDGKVVTDLTLSEAWASALAIQADGKIVVAGGTVVYPEFAVARLNSDGTLDASFGANGKVRTGFASGLYSATAVAIQADGKIVAVGGEYESRSHSRFALARYNSDGTLDASFGGDGKVTTDFSAGWDGAKEVAIQADGRIVVVGTAGRTKFALARYNSDGTLDRTFGVNGKVRTDFTSGFDSATGVAIQADGRIVVVGQAGSYYSNQRRTKFALARYNGDGTLDASFGGDGKVMTRFTSGYESATGVAIQADGKIAAVGTAGQNFDNKFALARYNGDGTLDATFGGDGKVRTDFSAGWDGASGVAVQADGKIVAVGAAGQRHDHSKFVLARYKSSGTLDASFGSDGKVETDFTPRGDGASGVAIQADGKIVAAGWANGDSKMVALARYLAAAVGSPPAASAVASSPSPGHEATASSIGDGVYLVGTDIPADLYRGITLSDTGGLCQISSDASGSSIIASDRATSGQFYVQVKKGQYLKLSGVQIVNAAAAAPTKMRSSVGRDGVYLVGTDIPAGRYRGEATFEFGYSNISRDANGSLGNSAGAVRPGGHFTIHVKKGQYLKLFSVKVRRVK